MQSASYEIIDAMINSNWYLTGISHDHDTNHVLHIKRQKTMTTERCEKMFYRHF